MIRFDLWIRCVALCVTCDFFSTTHTTHTHGQTDGHFRFFIQQSSYFFGIFDSKKMKNKKDHRSSAVTHVSSRVSIFFHSSAFLLEAFDTRNRAIPKHVRDSCETNFNN